MRYAEAENAILSGNFGNRLVFSQSDRPSQQKKSKPKDSIAALKKNSPVGDFFFKEKKRL